MPDLFELFRENESKLHERPPEQTWQKLQQRLERKRRARRRGILFLQMGVVALILLVLLFAGWAVVHFS
jgi:hypothetical protein